MRTIKRTYFTLEEIIKKIQPTWPVEYDTGLIEETSKFKLLLNSAGYEDTALTAEQKSKMADTLWTSEIVGMYRNCFAAYTDGGELTEEIAKRFIVKYLFVFNDTVNYYKTLIQIYDDQLDALMDGIKVTSENKINDTPQNVQGSYDWADDDHLSNVARNETIADGATKISRIKEIQDGLKDMYSEWARKFRGLFIYEI